MRVLLHACCGPCLLEPLETLTATHQVEIVYANPNIHPMSEYERRRDTLLAYAHESGLVVHEVPYDPGAWISAVADVVDDRQARCRACHKLRLELAAGQAAREGFDAIATTLSVSPYQDTASIREAGQVAAESAGIRFLYHDFRDRYGRATQRSRELGMYRQNYCGCVLSDVEATLHRRDREAGRRRRAGRE